MKRHTWILWIMAAGIFAGPAMSQVSRLPDASGLRIGSSVQSQSPPRLLKATGEVQLVVRLSDPPLVAMLGPNAKRRGLSMTAAQQRAYLAQLAQKQTALSNQIRALGGRELGRMARAGNALMVAISGTQVSAVSKLSGVTAIRPLVDHTLSLSTTVPYIGAAALQAAGVDGTGITVAVIDTGIDYTHHNLDGPGTVAAYTAAYGTGPLDSRNTTPDGLFPTSKVVGGFDFVGEFWPVGPLAPDPDPIDHDGHGTHVADIIAGHSLDGTHKGVAPGAKLLALKACSSVSSACSGLAELESLEFALDPNGDGDLSDAADVINLSLGSSYGQREDFDSEVCALLSRFGIVVVAAAGNDGDRPYIVGSPASTPEVIGVAQTQVPTALDYPLVTNSPASIAGSDANTATIDWAPITGTISADVVYVGEGVPCQRYYPSRSLSREPRRENCFN
jgi:subtilisin family serine protease